MNDYDYIIVGAGTAGCIIANRLSKDPSVKVLLVEAGGWDTDPLIHIPVGYGKIAGKRHDWFYETEPEVALGGRRIEQARGKVIGGCSSVNAMLHVRGHRSDFDRWAENGLPNWSYAKVLKYFKMQESWEEGLTEYRGGTGPIHVQRNKYQDPITDAYLESGLAMGYRFNADYNSEDQEGFANSQVAIRSGRRCGAATGYLVPALSRKNLTVATHAHSTRILFTKDRAIGVEYVRYGLAKSVYACCEVIITCGAINSPQLLMLSGIGRAADLTPLGIKVINNLPGVGYNLQDQVVSRLSYERTVPGTFHRSLRLDRALIEFGKAHFFGKGVPTSMPSAGLAFLKTHDRLNAPDVQIVATATSPYATPYLYPFSRPYVDMLWLGVILLRPLSRGYVTLSSSDPLTKPKIFQQMLSNGADYAPLVAGLKMLKNLVSQAPLQELVSKSLESISSSFTNKELITHIQHHAISFRHTACTCLMGASPNDGSVVDPELRVWGTRSLRVVDASVLPDMIGGNTNSVVMMIAEKASELIIESRQLGTI